MNETNDWPDYFQLMAQYNYWMNGKIYAICDGIPDSERKRDQGAYFSSIHGTLNHILFGDLAWMGRFTETPTKYRIGEEIYSDYEELRKRRVDMDRIIIDWTQDLTEEWLASIFEFTSMADGKTRKMPARILVTHMFNHQTHHRGQLTTILNQMGIDSGITDLPWLPILQK